ncbi:AIR synthase family protein [Clostridiaceae bacterium UIB06]|uniref:AIR synthase family protein n=1 Tax=Clostridium thailandense TaxID=2794346 RepID=A0A949TS44_9CLOT|nr:AIR synthase family protein [Clostridium thailandense]MBV7274362.1 AIR synthase family protein [Clostridium thailandense]MCH5136761.1 AIR synthase family protein [Clostridiaceae bacterium UIB06]
MKVGKLNWDDLKKIIDNSRKVKRDEVRIRSGVGEDCSVVEFGNYECILSTDPITGADVNAGKLAVHINCNDIASCGVEPIGILVTILAPESTSLNEIEKVMEEIGEETQRLNVEILGGHTEVTRAVNKMVISCTVIGKALKGRSVATSGAKDGDDIIVTKQLCLEGTSIAANDYNDKIKDVLTLEEIEEAKSYAKYLSVVKEGVIAGKFGVNSMHDITEGGVLGALWEVAEASGLGFKVYKEKMPISNITQRICDKYSIDPLRFISSGSMLITSDKGNELIKILEKEGIKATIIGKIIKGKGILIDENIEREVDPPERDELFVLEEKIQ